MKKNISIFMTAILAAGLLTGCAGATPSSGPVNAEKTDSESSQAPSSPESETDNASQPEESSGVAAGSETDEGASEAGEEGDLYAEFLAGNTSVNLTGVNQFDDGKYTLQELIDAHAAYADRQGMPDSIGEGYYSYIDCGNDGAPELALKLVYNTAQEYGSPETLYLIIRPFSGELTAITCQDEYYRYGTEMNKCGYFTSWGSGGAAYWMNSESFVSADGEYYEIYSREGHGALSQPVMSPDCLSDSLAEVLVPDEFDFGEGYVLYGYNFGEAYEEWFNEDNWDEYYTEVVRSKYYTFADNDDNPVMPDADYVALARENGVNILSGEEIEKMLSDRYALYGITDEIKNAGEPEWISFEVKDRISKAAQIGTFMANSDEWLLGDSDIASLLSGAEVNYAVADLNRNGRYEIIRSVKFMDPSAPTLYGICINRFYEISEDYESIYKIDYDVEYMWEEEISGWEHDLVSAADDYITCYHKDDSEYYYITPTRHYGADGEGYSENKMVLIARDNGTFVNYSGGLGMMSYNAESNVYDYYDDGGLTCSVGDYASGIEQWYFSAENGYTKELVYISYVQQPDPNDRDTLKYDLTLSADAFWTYVESV